ncbi:MAG: hypothetical protein IJO32_04640 [Bacilli bacterium]|nr:hypothetical protein [Bacilli bacterium]
MEKEYKIKNKKTLEEQIRSNKHSICLNSLCIGVNALIIIFNMVNGISNPALIGTNVSIIGLCSSQLANSITEKANLKKELEDYNKGGISK